MLEHGGKLRHAARQYNIPLENWLDLSTGINPDGWLVPMIPAEAWRRLPEDEDELIQAAKSYYGVSNILPVAGSQAAIQTLPLLRKKSQVAILSPAYAEHAHAWENAQHELVPLAFEDVETAMNTNDFDVLLLVNPNNPTGQRFSPETLLNFHKKLSARGGWLIIDEAFIDSTPELSLAPLAHQKGVVILRSLGKFFGLAGARVGFVLAQHKLLEALKNRLGPWTISGPARFIASQALQDQTWQKMMRLHLIQNGQRLQKLLSRHGLTPTGGTTLFQWRRSIHASMIHERLAQQAILTRLFNDPHSIRFGLPRDEHSWQRLDIALSQIVPELPSS
ncbi:MAG: threonine-phosphate decarboxylase CobD [Gammaproteobacteria bacterium]|nr:threonine-phosphate decarboxylase CobD [Gammaproteobacteria bacterium]